MRKMTATNASAAPDKSPYDERPGRLMQAAAVVGIVAGVVFVVAVVFFTGVLAGASWDGGGGYGRYHGPMGYGRRMGTCPMMSGGGMMPGGMMPGGSFTPTPTPTPMPPGTPRP